MGKPQSTGNLTNALAQDSSNNIGIGGSANASFKLQVTGTTNLTGALSGTSATFSGAVQGDFLVVGTTAATSGGLRLGTQVAIRARNVANTANIPLIESTASDGVSVSNGALILASTGAATFSSSVTAGGDISYYNGANLNAIITSGAANNGRMYIYSAGAADIGFQAGGSSWFLNNLGIGTNSPLGPLEVRAANRLVSNDGILQINTTNSQAADLGGSLTFGGRWEAGATPTEWAQISGRKENSTINNYAGYLSFATRPMGGVNTERMRITSGGAFKQTITGSYASSTDLTSEFNSNANLPALKLMQSRTTGNEEMLRMVYSNWSPNSSSAWFIYANDTTTARFYVTSNGGIGNFQANDVNLSDERTKKDIILLESYWDKFKAIEIVKFKYKDQTHDDFNIGVIAQQVEKVAPEFVDVDGWSKPKLDEDGNEIISEDEPLKSIYTADLHHATIKVLQECMSKIEEQQAQIEELKQIVATK